MEKRVKCANKHVDRRKLSKPKKIFQTRVDVFFLSNRDLSNDGLLQPTFSETLSHHSQRDAIFSPL